MKINLEEDCQFGVHLCEVIVLGALLAVAAVGL